MLTPTSRVARVLAGAFVLFASLTCTESATGPRTKRLIPLSLAPVFSQAATDTYRNLVSLDLGIDNIRVLLRRADDSIALDTVVARPAGQDSVVLNLSVELEANTEEFEATIELRDGEQVLFTGTQTVRAQAGLTSPPVTPVPVEYAGPGATVTTLDVNPDTTISGIDDIQMRLVGRDANNQIVSSILADWYLEGTNSAALGVVTPTGLFQPTGLRGTVTVTAELPTGVKASASVTIAPVPSSVVLVSGGGQTGPVGAILESPIVVEVRASDGGPVAGHTVNFAVTLGGGSIAPASVVTGTNGRASATLTLGTTPGIHTVTVTAAGLTPITASATATAGPATQLAIVAQPSASTETGMVLVAQPSVRLLDAFGNAVTTSNVAVNVALNPVGSWSLQGTTTVMTVAGVAQFAGLAISGPAGTTALTFSATGMTSVTSNNIVVTVPGPAVVHWINPSGGNWSTGANWSTGVVPTSADDVAIDLAGTYTVTLDVNATVEDFTLGSTTGSQTLTGTARTLTVNGVGVVSAAGVMTLGASSVLSGIGVITNGGTISLTGASTAGTLTLTNSGLLVTAGTLSITGPLSNNANATLRVEGSSAGGSANTTITSGFINGGTIELTSSGGGFSATLAVSTGWLTTVPGGTIISLPGAGGNRILAAQLDNQGSLVVQQALTVNRTDSDHSNSGLIDLTAGDLAFLQTGATPVFANAGGTITLGANRMVTFSGGTITMMTGSVTGAAASRVVVNNNATLQFTPAVLGVALTATNTTIAGNAVTIADGQTLTLLNSTLADQVTVQSGGTLRTHGTTALNGAFTVAAGALVDVQGAPTGGTSTLTVANAFTNAGRIELTSVSGGFTSVLAVTNGSLFNGPSGTIYSAVGAGGARTLAAQLTNDGTLEVDQPLTLQAPNADHANSGMIDLTTANLTVSLSGTTPSFTNTGGIHLGAGRTLIIGGGTVNLATGTLDGPATATLAVNNATLAFTTATVTVPMTITTSTIAAGAVTIPASQTLTLLNGGFTEPVTVQDGGFLVTHGTVALGTVNMPAGATLRVQGDPTGGAATLAIAIGFTNNGSIDLTSVSGGFSASLVVTTGSLTNAATIRSSVGAGGARTLDAQLVNQGTFDVEQPLTLSHVDASHENTGTIDLDAANLTVTQSGSAPQFTNAGPIILGASRTFTLTGGAVNLVEGSVSGPTTATLVVSGATLGFDPFNVTVPMTLNGTTIAGGSVTIQVGRTVTLLNGGLTDQVDVQENGLLLIHGNVALNAPLSIQANGTLRVQGDPTGGGATLTVANGFNNDGLIELTSLGGGFASQLTVTSGELNNSAFGTVHSDVGFGGARTLAASLNNSGVVDVDQPLTIDHVDAQHTSSGTIDLTNANLTVVQTGTNPNFVLNSPMTMGANRTWTVTGGTVNVTEGGIVGQPTSTLVVNSAEFSFFPGNVNVPLTLNNTTIQSGSLNINDSQTVTLLNGGFSQPVSVNGGGALVIRGTVALTGAMALDGGLLKVEGASVGGNANAVFSTGFSSVGTIEMTSIDGGFASQITVNSGSLTNTVDANIFVTGGAGGARIISAQLVNQGLLDIGQPLTLNRLDAQHSNGGGIDVSANLSVIMNAAGTFTNASGGTIQLLGSNRIFSVSGGTLDLAQGSVTSPETNTMLSINAGQGISFTPNTVTLPLQIVNTAINGGLTVGTSQSVTLINSNLPATTPVTILGGGTLWIRGGTTINGSLTQGGNLRVQGASFGGGALLTVANGFTNNGNIDLTAIDGGFGSQLIVTNGTLVNASNGGISSSLGTGGSREITAQLDNQGGLDVHLPLVITRANANHTNSGNVDISSNLTVTGATSFTNTGELFVAGSQTFAIGSGTVTNSTGGSIVGSGTLNVTGATFVNNGSISPESNGTGTFTINGNYTQGTGTVNINMTGTLCSQFDVLAITGTAVFTGTTLNVIPSCISSPLNGTQFTVVTTGGRTGTFTPSIPTLPGGVLLQPQYGASNLVLNTLIP